MYIELQGHILNVKDIKDIFIEQLKPKNLDLDDKEDGYFYVRFMVGPWWYDSRKFKKKEFAEDYLNKISDSIYCFKLSETVEID
jgi:hypothetical protein